MEPADRTGPGSDWRQAWRAFADRVSRPADTGRGPQPATAVVQGDEPREGKFEGFASPPGKF